MLNSLEISRAPLSSLFWYPYYIFAYFWIFYFGNRKKGDENQRDEMKSYETIRRVQLNRSILCVCALFLPIWKTLTEYWQILIRNFTAGIRNVQKVNKIPQFHSLLSHSLTLHAFLSVDGILTLRYTNIELYVILMPCISCIPFHPILKMCPFALHLSVGIYIATIFNLIYWHCNRVFTVQGSCMLSNKTKLSTYFSNRREQKKRNRNVSSVWSSGYRET